jgi:biotin transporter BioY
MAGFLGWAAQKQLMQGWAKSFACFAVAHTLVFIFGLSVLTAYTGWPQALALGYIPFLPGEAAKLFLATALWNLASNTRR